CSGSASLGHCDDDLLSVKFDSYCSSPTGECIEGKCTCKIMCAGQCLALDSSADNCGRCNRSCLGARCNSGRCELQTVSRIRNSGHGASADDKYFYWFDISAQPTMMPLMRTDAVTGQSAVFYANASAGAIAREGDYFYLNHRDGGL